MPSLRANLMKEHLGIYERALYYHRKAMAVIKNDQYLNKSKAGYKFSDGRVLTIAQLESDITFSAVTYAQTKDSKTILFPSEQIAVFVSLLKRSLIIPLDYKLPFQETLIEFTKPVEVSGADGVKNAIGFLLSQIEANEKDFKAQIEKIRYADQWFGFDLTNILEIDWTAKDTVTINKASIIYDDLSSENLNWTSDDNDGFNTYEEWDSDKLTVMKKLKQLVIACIGYINCENIYLECIGVTSDAINAKRERKGKNRLEPYYVCRIRGVQYKDTSDHTGEGAKHGFRYDVRGHFRRLTNGKTTWVRPHQRGIENEIYIPKTYTINRKLGDLL